ncbi:MAG: 6-bladed beta-propeller, partial [Bacteroidaceae bacterium]|nr:6-bladed beta-propeller [Bacteroidaceae bacterium]
MKTRTFLSMAILTAVLVACGNSSTNSELISIDVENSYPEKELVLQDFVDVEYVPLETIGEFTNKGVVKSVGKYIIAIVNGGMDGNIFLYERSTGKAIRKINRKGQGGEEYTQITQMVLDEEQNEMFIVDYPRQKIMVYNLEGTFLRSFN